MRDSVLKRPYEAARAFFATESAGGFVLIIASVAALILANSTLSADYFQLIHHPVGPLSVGHWINDALMALFFLLVGLEVKREFLEGELATWPQRRLPGIAAACGVVAPALIYLAINRSNASGQGGWAIPTATDIAFALAVVALLGKRVPASLKVLLTAIAVIDDLIAVLIIATFYTAEIMPTALLAAAGLLALMAVLNALGRASLGANLALGLLVWLAVYLSGVHATLAGVAVAMVIPRQTGAGDPEHSQLHRLERGLHPWVAWLVVPLFGFANSGVALSGVRFDGNALNVLLGIAVALVLGKQIGIFGGIRLACALGWAQQPRHATWRHVYGMAALCGIGFTMSMFIGLLAFETTPGFETATKSGILAGSVISAICGLLLLWPSRVK